MVDYAELIQGLHSSTIVDLLNNLYNCMDKIIDNHDVYKVETVGSQYVVVSGIPKRNGKQHTFEIADLALNLMSVIYTDFKMRHDNDKKLELKIGIHTGAAVASVVGTKMPRYCLFGDTMNTASRMESAGVSMRIQISEETFKILNASKKYILKKRGMVQVKGKGELLTYFLFGKHGFDKPLPSF